MKKTNDPARVRKAWLRFGAAMLACIILFAASSFGIFKLPGGGAPLADKELLVNGDYVQHDVYLILDNVASGYRGEAVKEVYAVVPVGGKMFTFCFPERWFDSESKILADTKTLLNGQGGALDAYIRVSGTVEVMSEDVATKVYDWFSVNKDWMQEAGLIQEVTDYADYLPDCVIRVDQVGPLPAGWVVGLTIAAGVCLLYALIVLLRIALKGFAEKPAAAELPKRKPEAAAPETPAAENQADAEPESSDTPVAVNETDAEPESSETPAAEEADVEVEIVETPAAEDGVDTAPEVTDPKQEPAGEAPDEPAEEELDFSFVNEIKEMEALPVDD